LELRPAPHTGRIVPGDAGAEVGPRGVATTAAPSALAPRPEAEAPGATHDDLAVDEAETPTEMAQAEERAAERQGQVIEEPMLDMAEGAETLLAQGESYGSGSYGAEGSARPPSPPPSQARTAPAYAREAQTAPMPSVRQPSVQQQPSPAPSAPQQRQQASTGGAGERYQLGMDHYRGRRYRAAAEEFEAVVRRPGPDRSLVPSALHHLARSLREAGDCRAAVRSYDNLLSQHGSYRGAPDAMIEAADCYRRLGQLSQARRLLERASQNAGVAARAQRELSRLAVAEREHRRASQAGAAAEAAPAEAEAAAADEN
ncbi:MAG: tetratricopeptide repeat protein, partial [Myxococcota bacterium]|nr:tetratricopeptide repeat protein [Myxococcota bacterium]